MRTAPSWFSRKLRQLDSKLGVVWMPNAGLWRIVESVPTADYCGMLEGAPLYSVEPRPMKVVDMTDLGSAVLDIVRMNRTARYFNYKDFIRRGKIKNNQDL